MMSLKIILSLALMANSLTILAQQPRYTPKTFVKTLDSTEFKYIKPQKDGFCRTFIVSSIMIWDLDDDSTTYIKGSDSVLICIEGTMKNNKRQGIFTFYIIDELNHSRRYKIYEQTFHDDKLNGQWKNFNLKGGLVYYETFKNSLRIGPAKEYWIDGRTVVKENNYHEDQLTSVETTFFANRNVKSELTYKNGQLNGPCKKYYENGTLQEYAEFKNAVFHGVRRYYYENGQIWIEQSYLEGKSWAVVVNYTRNGIKRNAGTLKDGNGTIIFYDEDGSIRETQFFEKGILKQ